MRSGALRNVVEIQRRDENVTTTGGSSPVWTPVASRRASIEPLSARELMLAGQAQIRATVKLRTRYFDYRGLAEKHRLVQSRNGRTITYNVESVVDADQMHREQVVMATVSEDA